MPQPPSEFDRELKILEAELKRLEAEYNQFFAGRLPRLPWDQRSRVDAMMKRFDRLHIQNTGDRFRFQTVQSRWAAFSELWERQMKAQETGRRPGRGRAAAGAASPVSAAPPPDTSARKPASAAPARDGVVATATISNLTDQNDRVRALYEQLTAARQAHGEKPLEYDRFSAVVQAQMKKLGTGGRDVAFKVTVKDGKVSLTANKTDES